jgi:hypothetical protein
MAVRPAADLEQHIADRGGWCEIGVEGFGGREAATDGLRAAADRIALIPHPDEPGDGLPNFINVDERDDGPILVFDIKDWGSDYGARIVAILVESLEMAGFVGVVQPHVPPGDEVPSGVPSEVVDQFGYDGLPVAFPPGFPSPAGAAITSATSSRNDVEVVWRSPADGPSIMVDLEVRLPAAGFVIVASAEVIDTPDYTGVIGFEGSARGEVLVRAYGDGSIVEATVFLGEIRGNAFVRSLHDRKLRRRLRFRIGG